MAVMANAGMAAVVKVVAGAMANAGMAAVAKAVAGAMASAVAMRGVVTCRRSSQPKPADRIGVRVKTAEVETGGAVFNPSNMRTK